MDDRSPGERAFEWLRTRATDGAAHPALIAATLLAVGAVAEMGVSISESTTLGGDGFRGRLLIASLGFGPVTGLLLVLAALLVLADQMAIPSARTVVFSYGLLLLGGLSVVANLVELISQVSAAGLPPIGVTTLAEAYAIIVFGSVASALLAAVAVYIGLTGRRLRLEAVRRSHAA